MMRLSKQSALWSGRLVAWFSCGAASAVNAKLASEKYGAELEVVYCDTSSSEHPDNRRFLVSIERWIGRSIKVIRSKKFNSVDEVFEQTRYMSGRFGARCTTELKKIPRFQYQDAADVHLFGFTWDEQKRIADFEEDHPDLSVEWMLRDQGITKDDCYAILKKAKIDLPVMYKLGFDHNNCLGCVKASSPGYWNKTRNHFPDVFARRAALSREIGARLVKLKGQRVFLDELPPEIGIDQPDGEIECGPQCQHIEMED